MRKKILYIAELDRLGIDPDHVRAWYSSKEDAVYINAARVRASEVPYLLLHEVGVHKGLPAVLGDQYDPVMDSIYGQFREEIEAVNEVYHYDLENDEDRRAATEEYLAERAEFCGHDWRSYAEDHAEEIEEYIAANGLSRENRKGAVRGLMAENGELELRPSRWKEFLQRVKMFFRKRKGFENYRFTDQEIETLIMRGLRKAQGRKRYEILRRSSSYGGQGEESSAGERFAAGDRLKYTIDNAMPSKEGYRVERVNENAGAEFNELQGVTCKDLQGVETWSKEEWIAYMSENGIIGKHSVPALEGRLVEVRGNLPKRLKGHSAYQDKLSMISIIPEMLENAVLVQSEGKPREGHFDNIKSHILAVKVRIGDGDSSRRYVVGMVIHEDSNGNLYYEHELTDIQKYADSAANQGHNLAGTPSASVMNIIRKSLLSSGFDAKNEKNTRFSVDQTETEEFKRWFGDSEVVDDDGNPLVVYHATNWDALNEPPGKAVFKKKYLGQMTDDNASSKFLAATAHIGFWFNNQKGKVKGEFLDHELACYLRIENSYEIGSVDGLALEIKQAGGAKAFVRKLKELGFDGVIVDDEEFGGESYVVFESNQIKSATDNNGIFDPENPDIRFSVESYSEEDWGDMVTFMKPYVGRAMERTDADYLKHLRDNGFDAASESDAHAVAAEALKANQRDARAAGKKAMYDWLILNDYWFGRVYDAIGKTDFLIRPAHRFIGEDFTGSYISPEFVKYSGKLKVKDKEAKLEKAKGYHSDELAKLIASKTGEDELEVEQQLIDYFRDLKKRASKADKENGHPGLFDKYTEWKASSPLLSAKLDEKLQAEWEAEKQAQLEEDFVSLVEHGTQISADWVKDNRELWKMLYQRLLSKEAPYNPSKKDLEALNAALRQEGADAASYAKGWADAKAALIEEKRQQFRDFREKVLSSKAEALKLQDEALAFARAHLPGENQGEFAKSCL